MPAVSSLRKARCTARGSFNGEGGGGRACGLSALARAIRSLYCSGLLRHGYGKFANADGSSYEGEWQRDQKHGKGKYTYASGNVLISCYEAGKKVAQGVKWSADRAQAWELQDGQPGRSISQEEAAQIAARIGLPVP